MPAAGGRRGRAVVEVGEHLGKVGARPVARGAANARLVGARSSRGDDRDGGLRARASPGLASGGIVIQTSASTPSTPDRPAQRSHASGCPCGAGARDADTEPEGLPERRDQHEEPAAE